MSKVIVAGASWEEIKEKIKDYGKTALKIAFPILGTILGAYGLTKYKYNQYLNKMKEREKELREEQEEIERQQKEIRTREYEKNKPSAEPYYGEGSKPIAFHFTPDTKYNTSQKRLNLIRKFKVEPMKRQHKTKSGFMKYRIKEANPNKRHFTKRIDGVNIIFEL